MLLYFYYDGKFICILFKIYINIWNINILILILPHVLLYDIIPLNFKTLKYN